MFLLTEKSWEKEQENQNNWLKSLQPKKRLNKHPKLRLRTRHKNATILFMSVVIRLSKTGKRGEARYRVVVTEKRYRRDGEPIETLGWYEKREKNENKEINKDRYNYWISKGAKPSPTVEKILSK